MKTMRRRPILTQFVIVVVGILAAFVLNAWWVGRGERQKEFQYLREIRSEFVAAKVLLDSLTDDSQARVRVFSELDQGLASHRWDATPDSFVVLGQALWYFRGYRPTMPVYADLVSSIGLNAITSDELRRALKSYELELENNEDYDDYTRTSMVSSWEPLLTVRLPYAQRARGSSEAANVPGRDSVGVYAIDVRGLARDLSFRNLIWLRSDGESALVKRRKGLAARVDSIVRLIDSELEP